ncbi:hypothetical protein HZH66_015320 [Vespula vulgaris]|uniref:Uncharacterized protein n=1 Tax=Vespula vulgaris TaxID=7454 RepID=A0A834IY32_VESVU|nr:hypothetical protein HZH66_015320 [Vespula vulgaris]
MIAKGPFVAWMNAQTTYSFSTRYCAITVTSIDQPPINHDPISSENKQGIEERLCIAMDGNQDHSIHLRPGGKIIDEAAFTDNILLFTSIRKATIPNSPSAHSYSNSLTNSSSANLTSIQSRIKEQDYDHQKEKKMGMTSEYTSKRVEIKTDSTMTNIRRISALNFINLAESGSECDNIKRHNAVISVITKDVRRCCYSTVVGPKINIIFGVRKRNLVGVMNSIALFVNAQVNAEPANLYRCGICKTNRRALEWLHSKPELLSENEEDESSMNNITTSHTDWSDSIGKQPRSFVDEVKKKTFENLIIRFMPEELHMRSQESIKKPAIAPVTKSKTDQISTKTKLRCLVNTC